MDAPQPPPPLWQSEVVVTPPAAATGQQLAALPVETSANVADAWGHVKQVVANSGKEVDLYDLLSATRRDDTYQPHVPTWPALLKPLSPVMADLPTMVQEKYRACQTMCFCGLFPEIGRAWASVDNSLFLWRYDRSNDVPVEYRGEEQAICAVGLVKPTPGIFLEAIQYVLVVCTTVEVVMIGVVVKGSDATSAELQLQPLPLYSVPSDNVVMCCVAAGPAGRVFLGGSDGHLYELQYSVADTWKSRRIQKVRVTGGLQRLLPAFLPQILFGAPAAIDRIVVDSERGILYTLSNASAIQVFDLRPAGGGTISKVAEVTDAVEAASKAAWGRELFRPGDKRGANIKHLAPIPTSESAKLHLLAVTADGRRIYFTTQALVGHLANTQQRPVTLSAVFARSAPPQSGHSIPGRLGAADMGRSGSLEVVAGLYEARTLVLAEAVSGEVRGSKLLAAAPCSTLPAATLNTSFASNNPGIRETIAELDSQLPGETCAIAATPRKLLPGIQGQLRMRDELATQPFVAAQRFVVITTAGVLELERKRPVDVLQSVLEERHPDKLHAFFAHYGAPEAAAMCYQLATTPQPAVTPRVVEEARAALENASLVGEPHIPEDSSATADPGANANGNGIYMGQAVNPNPEPEWSGAHRGLCLFASRLLLPVLEHPLVSAKRVDGGEVLSCSLPDKTLQVLEQKLRALAGFLSEQLARRQAQGLGRGSRAVRASGMLLGAYLDDGHRDMLALGGPNKRQRLLLDAVVAEERRAAGVRALVGRAAEALVLLRTLAQSNLTRLADALSDPMRAHLRQLTVRELVVDPRGEELASALISACVGDALDSSSAAVQQLAASLQAHCPSYFKEHDRIWYQAMDRLKAAEKATGATQRELTREAVAQLQHVPLACNLDFLTSQLTRLRYYEGLVELPLKVAAAMDPEGLWDRPEVGEECGRARGRREGCYAHVLQLLRPLVDPAAAGGGGGGGGAQANGMSSEDKKELKAALLRAAKRANDRYFHHVLYGALVDWGAHQELLGSFQDSPHLEAYMRQEVGLPRAFAGTPLAPLSRREVLHLRLLATLYAAQKRYQEASSVHWQLAMRRTEAGDRQVTLSGRVEHADQALIQAKASGAVDLMRDREADLASLKFQLVAVEALQVRREELDAEGQEEVDQELDILRSTVVGVDHLYNAVACPFKLWALALRLIHFTGAGRQEPEVVRTYWDWFLLEACLLRRGVGVVGAQLQEACSRALELASYFYPNEDSFPSAHVLMRLEQIAAGLWPPHVVVEPTAATPTAASEAIVETLLAITKGSTEAVQRVYDALLTRRGLGRHEAEASSGRLRLQVLGSLLVLCGRARTQLSQANGGVPFSSAYYRPFDTYGGWGSKAVGSLLAACDRCALEARGLGPDGEQLARQFEGMRQEVEARR